MSTTLSLIDQEFEIIDALEYITLADSFVKNKIGTGHGEAKLYVGNESERLLTFLDNIENSDCFFYNKDFASFLSKAEQEFKMPQQDYLRKDEMEQIYNNLLNRLKNFKEDQLIFKLNRVDVAPPRVYMNSKSDYYDYMRSVALPNISYLSVLKLKGLNSKTYFYFKIFIDYRSDIVGYQTSDEVQQNLEIGKKNITDKRKLALVQSRLGQGMYRNKLLEECPFCPITMVNDERLLVASHIKPWAQSNDNEKLDPKNGFMLTPTYDKLFDKGFITFNTDSTMEVSPWLSPMNQKRLGIHSGKKITALPINDKRRHYLEYHRENIFKK